MSEDPNTHRVLTLVKEVLPDADASIDDDGDVVVEFGDRSRVLMVSEQFLVARSYWQTEAPVNALSVISRVLNNRTAVGRLVFPEEGGRFAIDYGRAFDAVVSEFDVRHTIAMLLALENALGEIAEEYGYVL
ncbi:MAG: hypothetical protein JRI25_11810 [Deltaproteobacteria bacterium]|nr:hypothetical protein [Deltaproteobacteria bacterium]